MTSSRTRALAVVLACIMVLSVVAVAPASAGGDGHDADDGDQKTDGGDKDADDGDEETDDGTDDGDEKTDDGTYHLEQAGECIELTALEGDEPVSEFYDWEPDNEHDWSSQGTTHLQRAESSILFLYEDGDGTVSLVMVHEKVDDENGGNGGSASFAFEGMGDGTWAVRDDDYDGSSNYDTWDRSGSSHSIDWTWDGGRTDGGAYEGVGDDFQIRIDPAFNEDADLYGEHYDGEVEEWELLSGDQSAPERHSLDMDEAVTIAPGACVTDDDGGTAEYPLFEVTDESISKTDVTVGEPVNVTVNVTNKGTASGEYAGLFQADFERVDTKYAEIGVGETETLTYTTTFDEPDTYGLRVRTDHVGRVAVNPRPDPDATATLAGNGTVEANVTHLRAGSTVTTDLPASNGSTVSVERLNVTAANETDRMTVEVEHLDSADANTSLQTGLEPVEYLELTNDAPSAFGNATVAFSVRQDALTDGTDPADVTLLRYNATGEEWERVETRHRGATGDSYRYSAALDEFSTFAVAEEVPVVDTEADLATETVTAGDDVTVTATVRNDGLATATTDVPLVVGGEQVDAQSVEVAPGEQTEVTFEFAPDGPGQHTVSVGDAGAGTLMVEAQSTETPDSDDSDDAADSEETTDDSDESTDSTADTDDQTTDDVSSGEGPGFGAALALVAVLVGSLALAARRVS